MPILNFFGYVLLFILSIALIVLNAQGLHLINETVFFPLTNVHLSMAFFLGVVTIFYYFREVKSQKVTKDLVYSALAETVVFWTLICAIYFFK